MTTASQQADAEAARALQAEAALRDRERELSQLVDMVPSHLWRLTPDGEPTFFNKRMVDFIGLDVAGTDKPGMSGLDAVIETIHPDDAAQFKDALTHCLATGESFAMRYRLRRYDGVYRWMSSRAEPMRDQSGRIVQWYGLCHDIDDQVRAEDALRDRERELSQLVDMVPVHIRRLTPSGEPIFYNKRLVDFLGRDVINTDKPGMDRLEAVIATVIHPNDAPGLLETARHCFAVGEPFSMKYRMRRADGAYRWVDTRAEPLRHQSGAIAQWYVISVEIDDEMRAQQALRRREWELSQLVDMVPSLLWRSNPDGEPNFFNKRTIDFLGLDAADYDKPGMSRLAATLAAIIHPDDAAGVTEGFNHSFATGEPFAMTYRLRRADGVYRWMSARAEPMRDNGRIVQWYGLAHDIDDQMRAEEALRQSEQRLQQMIDAVPVYILSFSATGEPTYVNKRYQDYLGFSVPSFDSLRDQLRAIIHPEDFPEMHRVLSNCFKTGENFLMRFRRRGKDGVYRWTEGRAEPLRDRDGTIVQWYAVSLDIEDQMRAEEILRQSEQRLQQMIDAVPVHILSFSAAGEPTYINKRYRDYLGLSVPHFPSLQEQQRALIHPDDFAEMYGTLYNCFQTGVPFQLRYRRRGKDGVYRWTEGRAEPLRNQDGTIVQWYAVSLDIEDETRAQQALLQASAKLAQATQAASLAELSASIAHEVNQPLAAIVANSYACQRWLRADPPNMERAQITVERIIRDANAAADVVSRIRALFRQSVEPRSYMTLPSVIAEARNLMADEAMRRRIRVDVDVERNLPLVAFDRVQVQQVLINLIRNGMDAMDSAAGEKIVGMRVRRMGEAVQIEISDRGPGVEFPDKIFEPFFTTKDSGMGMGLAICRSIVESHGGRLWTEKNQPHGAKFIFTLPVEEKTAP